MKILADYHTHTVFSHGKGKIEDNVKVAISKGIDKIGISDHSYKHMTYGVKREDIAKMRAEIDVLNEKYPQIEILLGLECNVLDNMGNIDIDDRDMEFLDYILAGYHFGSTPKSISGVINHIDNYIIKSNSSKRYNTDALINAMKKYDIFCITHPGDKGDVYIEEVAKVALETDTRLEINSSHGNLNPDQLKSIKHIGNKFIIGSDAHAPERVGNFDLALNNIEESGIDIGFVENIIL